MQVSIIIVNYNTKALTLNCIESIYQHTQDIDFEIILVDNASADGSVDAIAERFPKVKIIASDENLGFGRANNLGAKHTQGEFLFMLNSDTLLIENSIKKMYDFFITNEKELKIGVLGAVLIDEKGKINGYGSEIPTYQDFNHQNWRKIPLLKKMVNYHTKPFSDIEKPFFRIGYVLGADMMMRKSLFEEVRGFDENFFMYYEESDLQNTITQKGFFNYVITNTKIIHLEGSSFQQKISNNKRMIVHSSQVYFMKKNYYQSFFKYKCLDIFVLFLSIFNIKYSFKENIIYIKKILNSYENSTFR